MKKTTYFMNILEEIKETKDDVLLFFISDVSRLSIGHVTNVANLEHHRRVMKLQMDQSDYREELYTLLQVQEIGLNALVSSVSAVNRYLTKNSKEVLCDATPIGAAEFAIQLVNEYYS